MNKEMSTIEVAIDLMEKKKNPQPINKLLKEICEIMGKDNDVDYLAQTYIDITTSARFIFCGDDLWDLKERHADLWDKDGSFFNDKDLEEDEDDGLTVDDYNLDDEDDYNDEDYSSDYEDDDVDPLDRVEYDYDEDEESFDDEDEDYQDSTEEDDDEDFDEEDYDNIMDDYEKYYE